MSFANIVGQFLQQGMAGQSRARLERAVGPQGLGSVGGIDQILKGVRGSQSGGGKAAMGGEGDMVSGLLGAAQSFLGSKQVGNLSGAQLGGLGALAGALLGGGGKSMKGALGGSAMAILGAMAVNALQAKSASGSGAVATAATADVVQDQIADLSAMGTEKLMVRAMIAAAKADGEVDKEEMERIVGKIGSDGVTPEERQFVAEELQKPLDLDGLVAEVSSPVVAAEVYAVSLMAIDVDTPEEARYLRRLAAALHLDATTVARLHDVTGLPG